MHRYAQQTEAVQLTRSLLLEPRASVNVKPNLQIIADDVKCSHGAAISDLEESQLFYFRARGIDLSTARRALVLSFAAEIFQRIPYPSLRKQVESHIVELLNPTLVQPWNAFIYTGALILKNIKWVVDVRLIIFLCYHFYLTSKANGELSIYLI